MSHDFANKKRPAKPAAKRASKKSSAPAAAPNKASRAIPVWKLLTTLAVVGALGWGLYLLGTLRSEQGASPAQAGKSEQSRVAKPAPSTPAPVVKKPETTPKVAEPQTPEGYKFYKMLPKSEVIPPEIEAYRSTPKSARSYSNYLLQAGSFRDPQDADRLRASLLLQGMPNVVTSPVTASSGTIWYRVRLGPFGSRSKLNKAYDQLVRMNLQPLEIKLSN